MASSRLFWNWRGGVQSLTYVFVSVCGTYLRPSETILLRRMWMRVVGSPIISFNHKSFLFKATCKPKMRFVSDSFESPLKESNCISLYLDKAIFEKTETRKSYFERQHFWLKWMSTFTLWIDFEKQNCASITVKVTPHIVKDVILFERRCMASWSLFLFCKRIIMQFCISLNIKF